MFLKFSTSFSQSTEDKSDEELLISVLEWLDDLDGVKI